MVDKCQKLLYNNTRVADKHKGNTNKKIFRDPGCGSAWLERLVWDQEVAGSNPVTPMFIPLGVNNIFIMRV